MDDVRIDAEPMLDDDSVMLAISCPHALVTVHASPREWQDLSKVRRAYAADRTDVRLGTCNGAPVWWSVEGGDLNIGVGADVETCDVGLALPLAALDLMAQVLAKASEDEWK